MSAPVLRPARDGDLGAIAALHAASWQKSYRGQLPDNFLDRGVADVLAEQWSRRLAEGDSLVVAEDLDRAGISGFVAVRTDRDPAYVHALHVAPGQTGRGVGRRLLAAAAGLAAEAGATGLYLMVLAQNEEARAFYARLGGCEGLETDDALFGHPVKSLAVSWTDLAALAG